MLYNRRQSTTPSNSLSSTPSATEPKVEPAFLLYLLTVHLESGSHSQIYQKTSGDLYPRYYIHHGAEGFSRALHLGDASAASPIVGEVTGDELTHQGRHYHFKSLYRRPPGLRGLFSTEQVLSAVDGQEYRWQRKRDGSLCIQNSASKMTLLTYTPRTTALPAAMAVFPEALPYLEMILLLLLHKIWLEEVEVETSEHSESAEDVADEDNAFW